MNKRYAGSYEYAVRNGYAGTYEQYVELQYAAYLQVCIRCEIEPLPRSEWL